MSQVCRKEFTIHVEEGPEMEGLYAWYRADTIALNDGDPVTLWNDETANANVIAAQGTATAVYLGNALNGLPMVRFIPDPGGIVSLLRNSVDGPGPVVLGGSLTGITQAIVVRLLGNASFPDTFITEPDRLDTAGGLRGNKTGGVNSIYSVAGSIPLTEPIGDWQVITLRQTNSSGAISLQTNGQTNAGVTLNNPVFGDNIGLMNGSMDVTESLWYRKPLSDLQLAKTRNYLANKYAITISV